jgi:zinc/manganese transport system substrate-binding protein
MKHIWTALFLLLAGVQSAHAALNVFSCEPEWAALVKELAGDRAEVYSATVATQDPHRIQARPSLIAKLRQADLLVCTGAELEGGWLPVLLQRANNPKVLPGQQGYFETSGYVTLLERLTRIDRAEGDVHPQGNPHFHLDPHNILRVAAPLTERLGRLDGANRAYYEARLVDFRSRWEQAIARWEQEGANLHGVPVVTQHKGWVYLFNWLGLKEIAVLEPKPGVPPSSAYLTEILGTLQHQPAKMVIRAAYQESRPSEWLAERTNVHPVELPYTVGGAPDAVDLFGLFDATLKRLKEGAQ